MSLVLDLNPQQPCTDQGQPASSKRLVSEEKIFGTSKWCIRTSRTAFEENTSCSEAYDQPQGEARDGNHAVTALVAIEKSDEPFEHRVACCSRVGVGVVILPDYRSCDVKSNGRIAREEGYGRGRKQKD